MSSQAEPGWCRALCLWDTAMATGTFRYTIDDFTNRNEKVESTCFDVNGLPPGYLKTKWQLVIYPKGTDETSKDYIGMFLYNKGQANVFAEHKMMIIDCAENERESFRAPRKEFETSGLNSYLGYRWLKRDKFNDHPDLLRDGNLTIQCTITVFGPLEMISGSDCAHALRCKKQVLDNLGKVFSDKQFTDIKIQCEGQAFDCHMVILAARSPVFMAMFQSDMKERQTQTVTIDDFKAVVVREMLNFIYTGKVSSLDVLSNIALDLFKAADKYQLDLLKTICEESLCSTLNVTNCVKNLVLGDMYQTLKLKSMALRLLVDNLDSITSSNPDILKDLCKERPELAVGVMMVKK